MRAGLYLCERLVTGSLRQRRYSCRAGNGANVSSWRAGKSGKRGLGVSRSQASTIHCATILRAASGSTPALAARVRQDSQKQSDRRNRPPSQAHPVLLVMELMREAHEGRALEFDEVRPVGMGQIVDKRADIGAGVGIRWAKVVVVRIAEGVAGNGAGMKQAEPRVVKAHRPAGDARARPRRGAVRARQERRRPP